MNLDYELKSLRSMAVIEVTRNIIEYSRIHPSRTLDPGILLTIAEELVQALDIPQSLKTEIIVLNKPIVFEMIKWYCRYGDGARLVLTSHGTVDAEKSARVIFDTNQPIIQQYKVACDLCLEDDILRIGRQLPVLNQLEYNCGLEDHDRCIKFDAPYHRESLSSFWFCIYQGHFRSKLSHRDLSAEKCAVGFARARSGCNALAMKYFLENASEETIRLIRGREWFLRSRYGRMRYENFCPSLQPAIANTLVRMMANDEMRFVKQRISYNVLRLLIRWPYQHLFLKASESLMPTLEVGSFWKILSVIAVNVVIGHQDYDYKGLFIDFWNMGARHSCCQRNKDYWLPFHVFFMLDERLAFMVFDKISDAHKERYLFNFDRECFCLYLIYKEYYVTLDLLVRVCRERDEALFLKFQKIFTDHSTLSYPECHAPRYYTNVKPESLSQDERKLRILNSFEAMSKYKPK